MTIHSPSPGHKQRPFGLRALIVLLLLQAVTTIAVIAALLLLEPLTLSQSNLLLELDDAKIVSVIVYAILACARLLIAIGLWRLQHWAWMLMMIQLAVSMAMEIQTYYAGEAIYFSMIMNVILVFYLNQHEVQDLFMTPEAAEAT